MIIILENFYFSLTILVNRGWVPSENKSQATRWEGQVRSEVDIVGLVRLTETRKPMGMKNIPEKGFWMLRYDPST